MSFEEVKILIDNKERIFFFRKCHSKGQRKENIIYSIKELYKRLGKEYNKKSKYKILYVK